MTFRPVMLIGVLTLSQQLSADASQPVYSAMPAVDCVINPYRVVDISSPVAGVIERLYVERSQPVSAGQVVAELEASVERANVELARYRASVESEIGLGRVNINFDRLRRKRVQSLLEEQNISRENADQIEREVQLSRWKLKQARELAEIRKLELRKAEEQLRQKSISAPFDGFVLDTFKYRGEYVEDQAILRLAQLDPLVVEAIVPMENFGQIQAGMQAEVMPEVLLKEKLKGEVIAVDRIGDTASNTFGVKLKMPNPENRIPAGLECIVKFLDKTPEQVAGEAAGAATGESPKGFIERPVETPGQRVFKTALATTGVTEPSSLLGFVGNANAAEAPQNEPVEVDSRAGTSTEEPASGMMDGGGIEMPASSAKIPTSYMVLIEKPATEEATRALVDRLRLAGETDFLVYSSGDLKGLISMGVFSSRASAIKRQREIDRYGITTFTEERFQ